MHLSIEIDREDDGRWIAEALELPGVMACGATREDAISNTERLAIEVIADRIQHGELAPSAFNVSFQIGSKRDGSKRDGSKMAARGTGSKGQQEGQQEGQTARFPKIAARTHHLTLWHGCRGAESGAHLRGRGWRLIRLIASRSNEAMMLCTFHGWPEPTHHR